MGFGLLLLLLLLGLVWVFAVLLVNVFGLDSVIAGWVFLAACIALVNSHQFSKTLSSLLLYCVAECVVIPLHHHHFYHEPGINSYSTGGSCLPELSDILAILFSMYRILSPCLWLVLSPPKQPIKEF